MKLTACEVDLAAGVVRRDGQTIRLTATEVTLLGWFAERAGRAVPREALLTEVWGYAPGVESRAPDNTIARLRVKIEVDPKAPDHLLKVYGVGYRFELAELAEPDEPYAFDPVAHFLIQAQRVRWDFALTPAETPTLTALVVDTLQGHEEAITLAAAQSGQRSVSKIITLVSEHLSRHRGTPLDGMLSWCWGLLTAPERAALTQAAVFRGGFTLRAAEAVLDLSDWPDAWMVDTLQSLRDQALLHPAPQPKDAVELHFTLTEALRDRALARLRGGGSYDEVAMRHACWYATEGTTADRENLTIALTRAVALQAPEDLRERLSALITSSE